MVFERMPMFRTMLFSEYWIGRRFGFASSLAASPTASDLLERRFRNCRLLRWCSRECRCSERCCSPNTGSAAGSGSHRRWRHLQPLPICLSEDSETAGFSDGVRENADVPNDVVLRILDRPQVRVRIVAGGISNRYVDADPQFVCRRGLVNQANLVGDHLYAVNQIGRCTADARRDANPK